MRRRRRAAVAAAITAVVLLAGCGFGEDQGGGAGATISWYVFNEPGGAFNQAIDTCNKEAGGEYTIRYVRLPTDADQQRELVARRLAAQDSDIDIVGMDVIWTAEFAEAGWIRPWEGARAERARQGKLEGPLRTAVYKDTLRAIPFTSNTQLLWYRKDRLEELPENMTWDEMIDIAAENDTSIEVQAARYEGLTVWVNSLIESAGGSLVDEQGNVQVDESARRAAEIVKELATRVPPPGMSNNKEDQARLGFESGRSDFQLNYTFVYASAGEKEGFQEKMGFARYPRVDKDKPSRPPLGGINLGVGQYSQNPELAFDAAECLAKPENQVVAAEKGGLAPSTAALYDNPKIEKAFPFADVLRESLEDGAPRPVNPAYSDVSLAIQKTFHPPEDVNPATVVEQLRDKLEKAAEGKIF